MTSEIFYTHKCTNMNHASCDVTQQESHCTGEVDQCDGDQSQPKWTEEMKGGNRMDVKKVILAVYFNIKTILKTQLQFSLDPKMVFPVN